MWIFGYGSLIWRPDFPYRDRQRARLHGWQRRFWQGSHDHRGTPDNPGRVVTLIETATGYCDGIAYQIDEQTLATTLDNLDYREKNGYARRDVTLVLEQTSVKALVYLATPDNHAFLGDAPIDEISEQIRVSVGPSGRNLDYLRDLAGALRKIDAVDAHVFELAARLEGD